MPESHRLRGLRASLLPALIVVLASTGFPTPGHAQSDPDAEAEAARGKLEQIEREIKRIAKEIARASSRHSKLEEQLRTAEVELGQLQQEILGNQKAIESEKAQLVELQGKRDTEIKARDEQQARIAIELRTAWKVGSDGQVKVLLNQENPHTIARSMGYYRYFFQARNKLLEQYRATLQELELLQERIDTTLAQLETRQQTLETQKVELHSRQAEREVAMTEISASISTKGEQLKQKEEDRLELENLLQAIEKAAMEIEVPENYDPFKTAQGKMPWPVAGKRSNQFGRPRNEGKMRWQGITIPAKEGVTVNAIHHGRVVYADWLRGSGLLLIIDHGDGYMSLYAHNQSLMKEVGDWVAADTPISTVGNTGGLEQPALYFEIRHQGKPVDPAKWCRS